MDNLIRCRWAAEHPELIDYHDHHWGQPQHDDRVIFGDYAQCVLHAGLNWLALLKKRDDFAAAFDYWDVAKIAQYDSNKMERLMTAPGVIHNFQKLNAVINNASKFIEVQLEFGSFDAYVWRFVDGEPIICDHISSPATKPAEALSADLKQRGYKFAGPATAIGLMQDIGMINDHDKGCYLAKQAA